MTTPQTHRPLYKKDLLQDGDEYRNSKQGPWMPVEKEFWGDPVMIDWMFRRPLPAQQHGETHTPHTDAAEFHDTPGDEGRVYADFARQLERELDIAVTALKSAYARGHYCDMGERCPGCIAGHALEQITGRKWTQEECG